MFTGLVFYVVLSLVVLIVAFKSIRKVKEGEYAAVFRLGKLDQVRGPGWIIVVPMMDRVLKVPLYRIMNWQTMPQAELEKKVADLALRM